MAWKYRKVYRIYEISADGLLKVPTRSEGYGYYSKEDREYTTEQEAVDRIIEKDLGDCVVLACVGAAYVEDDAQ